MKHRGSCKSIKKNRGTIFLWSQIFAINPIISFGVRYSNPMKAHNTHDIPYLTTRADPHIPHTRNIQPHLIYHKSNPLLVFTFSNTPYHPTPSLPALIKNSNHQTRPKPSFSNGTPIQAHNHTFMYIVSYICTS